MPEQIEEPKTLSLVVGLFVLVGLIGTAYLISNPELTYYCNITNIVGMCNKLSSDSLRCYFNQSNLYSYKYCKSGWEKFNDKQVIGSPIDIPTYVEISPFAIKSDFKAKEEIESYVNELKSDIKVSVDMQKQIIKPYSNEIEIFWLGTIYKEKEEMLIDCSGEPCVDAKRIIKQIIYSEVLTTFVPESYTTQQINQTIYGYAQEWASRYKPNLFIEK